MNIRKTLFLLFIMTSFLAISVLVWYFLIRKPSNNPSLNQPTNPFGNTTQSLHGSEFIQTNEDTNTTQDYQTEIIPGKEKKLIKVWDKPTAGFAFIDQTILINSTTTKLIKGKATEITIQKKATSTKTLFVDRITGYIYGYSLDKKKVYQITNSTIPGIYDAYFFDNGASVIMRYLDQNNSILSILAKVPQISENSSPLPLSDKTNLPNNISNISVSNSSKTISYFVPASSGGLLYSIKNGKTETSFSSPLSEVNIKYGGEIPYMTTSPSAYVTGFTINTQTNERVLGDKTGLTTLPSTTGDDFLSSVWTNSGLATFIFSKKTGNINILNLKTLSDKCVWGKNSIYALCGVPQSLPTPKNGLPDDWYMGLNRFSDDIYFIGNKTPTEYKMFDFATETKGEFDVIKMKMTSANDYLGFINKRNGSFWLLHTPVLAN